MARINSELCTGCRKCTMFCSVDAIRFADGKCHIHEDECVECYVCIRKRVCPVNAIEVSPLDNFYREFQHMLSDPVDNHPVTGVAGRGTEEVKTNDVTGRVRRGYVGVCIDMGRPGLGVRLRDAEIVAVALCGAGVTLTPKEQSPLTTLMPDPSTGRLEPECLHYRLLSVIVEGHCKEEMLKGALEALQDAAAQIESVFSLGLILRTDAEGKNPALKVLDELGLPQPYFGKVNFGTGRPLAER